MIVGLTGGIGSGKTTVAKIFYDIGVPIYVSDIEAKKLMVTHSELIKNIKTLLGDEAYENDKLNRSYISDKIFKNKKLLNAMNNLVHPIVAKDFQEWYKAQSYPYVIKESAILFESGAYKKCDAIITVTAPIEERINRVVLRDNVTKKQVLHRVMNQMSDEEKIDRSNYIIINKTLITTEEQVAKIHELIINKTQEKQSF